jgi:uncharacterized protein
MRQLAVDKERLAGFCLRWKIVELSLFGSALREDFRAESDVDVLVTYAAEADWSLVDHFRMEQELTEIMGREVDLVTRESMEKSRNWIRRREILSTARPLYVA